MPVPGGRPAVLPAKCRSCRQLQPFCTRRDVQFACSRPAPRRRTFRNRNDLESNVEAARLADGDTAGARTHLERAAHLLEQGGRQPAPGDGSAAHARGAERRKLRTVPHAVSVAPRPHRGASAATRNHRPAGARAVKKPGRTRLQRCSGGRHIPCTAAIPIQRCLAALRRSQSVEPAAVLSGARSVPHLRGCPCAEPRSGRSLRR